MGLKFRIFTKAEHYTMSSPAALLRKVATASSAAPAHAPAPAPAPAPARVAAPKAAPPPPPPAANQCREFRESGTPCSRKNCRDADCRKANASAPAAASSKYSAPAKSAGSANGGIPAQLAAMEARLTGHIDSRFKAAEESVRTGFLQQEQSLLGLHQAVAQSQVATQNSFQGLANAMATAISGGQRQLPAPVSRQIGDIPQEIAEPQRQITSYVHSCFVPNEGGSGRFAAPSSQPQQQSVAAYGGGGAGAANDSSRFFSHRETSTEFRGSSGGSTIVAARQLGMNHHLLAKFEENFSKMKQNDFNYFTGNAIRNFVASFAAEQQDEIACVLLGVVNGKKYPTHKSIIVPSKESVFRRFFGELAAKFPNNAVKTTNNRGQDLIIPFKTLSTDQSAMLTLIRVLRGEE